MNSTSEIDMLLELKKSQERPVSTNTLEKYKSQYNYLTKTNNYTGDWVTETSEKELIELIKSLNIKSSGRLGYLNVLMLIKQLKNQSVNAILKYRDTLFKENDVDTAVKIKEKINQNLPTYNEIEYFVNNLYSEGDWIRFLYNYLIFTYALRNKDVNLEIISVDKFKKLSTENKINKNYLVVKKTECELVVDNYKTRNAYGTKHIKIRSRKVLKACQLLGEGLILKKANNEPVGDSELSYYLKLYMNQDFHLTEADYFKINLLHIQTQPNCINRLNELCNSRGSKSIGCIDKYYNLCDDN